MKRILGTIVLFILIILTAVALTQLHTHATSALDALPGSTSVIR